MTHMPRRAKVLLLDDLDDDREIYGGGLAAVGFEVSSASPATAVDSVRAYRPDVVVLHVGADVSWEICDDLRRAHPHLPVIAITASVRPDRRNREHVRRRPNCAAFVGKPCTHTELGAVITRVLRGERAIEMTTGSERRKA